MVINAIKAKLKGGLKQSSVLLENQSSAVNEEEIPDELPPLMEEEAENDKTSTESTPNELPKIEITSEDKKTETIFSDKENKPPEVEKISLTTPTKSSNIINEKKIEEIQKNIESKDKDLIDIEKKLNELPPLTSPPPSSNFFPKNAPNGFFGTLSKVVTSSPNLKEELLSQDLVTRMKSFWSAKKTIPKGSWDNEKILNDELNRTILELQNLESKWHIQAMSLEHERQQLHIREKEIKQKSKELQRLLRASRFYKYVDSKNAFTISNGMLIHSLKELFDAVSIMDEDTFRYHVNGKKNDFALWINHVFGDAEISDALRKVSTRGATLNVLESMIAPESRNFEPGVFDKKPKRPLHPSKIFITCKGRKIRTLEELPDSLRQMDEEEFHHHVTIHKNDFARWVFDVFNKKDLARRLGMATKRDEMINILEIYL